jgi:hypothetical protein
MNKENMKFLFFTVVFIGLFIFMLEILSENQNIVYGAEPLPTTEVGYPYPEPIVYPTENVGYPYPISNDPIMEIASDPYPSIVTIVVSSYNKKPLEDSVNFVDDILNKKIKEFTSDILTVKLYETKYFIQRYGKFILKMK